VKDVPSLQVTLSRMSEPKEPVTTYMGLDSPEQIRQHIRNSSKSKKQ
jgi:hypothetical protein